jgi:hypothetical protein
VRGDCGDFHSLSSFLGDLPWSKTFFLHHLQHLWPEAVQVDPLAGDNTAKLHGKNIARMAPFRALALRLPSSARIGHFGHRLWSRLQGMRESKQGAPRRPPGKAFSLYPLTLEEVADKLLATPPSPRRKTPVATKAKSKR